MSCSTAVSVMHKRIKCKKDCSPSSPSPLEERAGERRLILATHPDLSDCGKSGRSHNSMDTSQGTGLLAMNRKEYGLLSPNPSPPVEERGTTTSVHRYKARQICFRRILHPTFSFTGSKIGEGQALGSVVVHGSVEPFPQKSGHQILGLRERKDEPRNSGKRWPKKVH